MLCIVLAVIAGAVLGGVISQHRNHSHRNRGDSVTVTKGEAIYHACITYSCAFRNTTFSHRNIFLSARSTSRSSKTVHSLAQALHFMGLQYSKSIASYRLWRTNREIPDCKGVSSQHQKVLKESGMEHSRREETHFRSSSGSWIQEIREEDQLCGFKQSTTRWSSLRARSFHLQIFISNEVLEMLFPYSESHTSQT